MSITKQNLHSPPGLYLEDLDLEKDNSWKSELASKENFRLQVKGNSLVSY